MDLRPTERYENPLAVAPAKAGVQFQATGFAGTTEKLHFSKERSEGPPNSVFQATTEILPSLRSGPASPPQDDRMKPFPQLLKPGKCRTVGWRYCRAIQRCYRKGRSLGVESAFFQIAILLKNKHLDDRARGGCNKKKSVSPTISMKTNGLKSDMLAIPTMLLKNKPFTISTLRCC